MTTAKLYKHQTTLVCSGLAVIAFGLWSIVRVSLLFYLQHSRILQLIMEGELGVLTGQSTDTITAILFGVAIGFLILDLLFRLYIGLSAIREGNGKRRRLAYVVLAIVYLVFLLGSDVYYRFLSGEAFAAGTISAFFIDLTSSVAFMAIIRSSLAIRRLKREEKAEGGAAHAA